MQYKLSVWSSFVFRLTFVFFFFYFLNSIDWLRWRWVSWGIGSVFFALPVCYSTRLKFRRAYGWGHGHGKGLWVIILLLYCNDLNGVSWGGRGYSWPFSVYARSVSSFHNLSLPRLIYQYTYLPWLGDHLGCFWDIYKSAHGCVFYDFVLGLLPVFVKLKVVRNMPGPVGRDSYDSVALPSCLWKYCTALIFGRNENLAHIVAIHVLEVQITAQCLPSQPVVNE